MELVREKRMSEGGGEVLWYVSELQQSYRLLRSGGIDFRLVRSDADSLIEWYLGAVVVVTVAHSARWSLEVVSYSQH